MRIKSVKLIDETEFSQLVREAYGRPYRLQQQDHCMGQNEIELITIPDEGIDIDDPQRFEEWRDAEAPESRGVDQFGDMRWDWEVELHWEREFYPPLQELVNDMYERSLLPQGDYAIRAYW
jgi:hypothetical protein